MDCARKEPLLLAVKIKRSAPDWQGRREGPLPRVGNALDDGDALNSGHCPTAWRMGQIDPTKSCSTVSCRIAEA